MISDTGATGDTQLCAGCFGVDLRATVMGK